MKEAHNTLNSNSSVTIKWTRPLLEQFKKDFALAEQENRDVFIFNDHGYTVGYAYYLISFLEGTLS